MGICIPRMIMRFLGRSMISGDIAIMIMRRLVSLEIAESMVILDVSGIRSRGTVVTRGMLHSLWRKQQSKYIMLLYFSLVCSRCILRMIYMMVLLATEQLILCIY